MNYFVARGWCACVPAAVALGVLTPKYLRQDHATSQCAPSTDIVHQQTGSNLSKFAKYPSDRLVKLLSERHARDFYFNRGADWYSQRTAGKEVSHAGGRIDLTSIAADTRRGSPTATLRVFTDVDVLFAGERELQYKIQLELRSSTGEPIHNCHFLQFARSWEIDTKGVHLQDVNLFPLNGVYMRLGEWYLDTRWLEPLAQPVYYDAIGANNRTPTEVSMFDSPRNNWADGVHSKIGMEFVTFVVCGGEPRWEVRWQYVADLPSGEARPSWRLEVLSGRAVREFPPPFDTRSWRLGYSQSDARGVKTDGAVDVPSWLVKVH